jgi:hypothetical protein
VHRAGCCVELGCIRRLRARRGERIGLVERLLCAADVRERDHAIGARQQDQPVAASERMSERVRRRRQIIEGLLGPARRKPRQPALPVCVAPLPRVSLHRIVA